MAERNVVEGERHIAGQRRLLAWLEQVHPGKSESAKVARDILATFEKIQTLYVADRDDSSKPFALFRRSTAYCGEHRQGARAITLNVIRADKVIRANSDVCFDRKRTSPVHRSVVPSECKSRVPPAEIIVVTGSENNCTLHENI